MKSLRESWPLQAGTIAFGTLLFLQSCTVGPDYQEPELNTVLQDEWQAENGEKAHFSKNQQPDVQWWQQFDDELLNQLIAKLHSSSLPLAQARERIVEVNAQQGVVGAERRLQLAAALGYTRAETGDEAVSTMGLAPGQTLDVYSAGLVAGWELDLWGRVARLLEAGEQNILSSYAEYQAMLTSLTAELALTYMEARTLQERLVKVKENITLQQKTLELARSSFDAGNGSELAVSRTQRLVSVTKARVPELERQLLVARNKMKVLLGLPPKEKVLSAGSMPRVPMMLGLGLPVDLLVRRPDIRIALHRYHAAVAGVGAAEAEKYPSLSISGTLSLSSDSLGGVFDSDSLIYTLGPGLNFPLLTGSRISSNIAMKESRAEQLRLALEQQILAALSEVENAASGLVRSQQRVKELSLAEEAAIKSVTMADDLYQAGLGDFFQVLDNQQQLVTIQESLLQARQQALSEVIVLYRALGGGWENTTAEQGQRQ